MQSSVSIVFAIAVMFPWNTEKLSADSVGPVIHLDKPMAPPTWALLERELLKANTEACQEFFAKYFDERGYLECIERWGGDDGPDDAIENCNDWPILHALGAPDVIRRMYQKAWEGHLRQYTEARTTDVPFARDGMYYKEFPVMFDWVHNGEGLNVFMHQGLSDPFAPNYEKRVTRYAGFYLNEDPQAPNYDPEHKIIRSLFNGSRGPLLRKATAVDWAGDPIEVADRFTLGHGERSYQEMLDHFRDYNDIIGDHPQNLCATNLALNAYMLTGDEKYKHWLVEYVDAWVQRTEANGGIIPTNIGLDGRIGSACEGKWYGGVYGWGFSVEVPQTGELAHRNTHHLGLDGFGNAFLLTGNARYLNVWRNMIDKVNSNSRQIDGVRMYPRMRGDQGWYAFGPQPYSHGTVELFYWSMDDQDRRRFPMQDWLAFLDGKDPAYPIRRLQADVASVREKTKAMRADTTTPDTRLADDPMKYNPATVTSLIHLMLGGIHPGRSAGPLHCRARYFDPIRRRPGLPEDVAALVTGMTANSTSVSLVNISQTRARTVLVQIGSYGEHECETVTIDDDTVELNDSVFYVRLEPGCGGALTMAINRYVNRPSLRVLMK